jgi:hypothetical protein
VRLTLLFVVSCGARTGLVEPLEAGTIEDTGHDVACVSTKLSIPSTRPWTDTGVDVRADMRLVITASGTVRYGGGSAQVQNADGVNWDGQKFFSTAVLPNAIIVSLIGKIGDRPVLQDKPGTGDGFVGTSYDAVVPTSGRLFLGYNDQVSAFADNSGSFVVTIRAC